MTLAPQVGIKPDVATYNSVLSACGSSAGGSFRPCSVNDTAVFSDFVEKSASLLQYHGGRLNTKQFALKWKGKYPEIPLQTFLRGMRGGKRSVSDLLKQSPRFEVVSLPHVTDCKEADFTVFDHSLRVHPMKRCLLRRSYSLSFHSLQFHSEKGGSINRCLFAPSILLACPLLVVCAHRDSG